MTEAILRDLTLLHPLTNIVVAYVSNNSISPADVPLLIASTHMALRLLSKQSVEVLLHSNTPQIPAVALKKSLTPDKIVCLECGKSFSSIKRHLGALHGMTPEHYRDKWRLPSSYPMVAPRYSAVRAALAKDLGLGRKTGKPARSKTSFKENA